MTFKKGDKVMLIEDVDTPDYNTFKSGLTGVVCRLIGKTIGVEFDEKSINTMDYSLKHDLLTLDVLPEEKGFYFQSNQLKRVIGSGFSNSGVCYTPGQKINDFVKDLIKSLKGSGGNEDKLKFLRAWQNCVLPSDVQDLIEEALTVILRSDKFEEWGLNSHFEKGITNSILLYGLPGTGKTMISEAIAAVLGRDLMKLDTGKLQSNVPGQTERNIQTAFKEAAQQNAVLLIDECDSLLYDRNAVGSIIASEINVLLQELERFNGVVILTTNRLHKLDGALQRRIIAKIEVPLPDKPAREAIFKALIPKKLPLAANVNLDVLSEEKLSGGEIKNVILLAARKAIAKNKDNVSQEDFEGALRSVLTSKKDFSQGRPLRELELSSSRSSGFNITNSSNKILTNGGN